MLIFELLKDIKTSIVYTSTINPGGWVPKKALRSVYRREYPRFLRTFTQYVSKKNQSLPLDLINQSIGKHISSFWTLYCHLVPKNHVVILDQLVRYMYLLPSHLYCPAMCLPTISNWYIIATIRSIIQKCLTVDHPASDLSTVRPPSGLATFNNMVYSRYQFKYAVQIKKDRIE